MYDTISIELISSVFGQFAVLVKVASDLSGFRDPELSRW